MADTTSDNSAFTPNDPRKPWLWHPELPLNRMSVLSWPPRPLALARWFVGRGFLWSQMSLHILLGVAVWFLLPLTQAETATFRAGWIAEIWLRNLVIFTVIVGGLHLWLFTFRRQGDIHRFDSRPLERDSAKFLFRNQVYDNVFWSLASGVTIWTAYEVVVWWAWANGTAPRLTFAENPVWFLAFFPFLLFAQSAHFYLIHRALHWPWLYRFHRLHHHNVAISPWSGISMHPVEHVIYLSSLLVHLVLPTHPIHLIAHGTFMTVGAGISHTGFGDLQVRGRNALDLGDFFHQLHHRFYNCNYGSGLVPLDRWFGSEHDGTAEATTRIMKAQRSSATS